MSTIIQNAETGQINLYRRFNLKNRFDIQADTSRFSSSNLYTGYKNDIGDAKANPAFLTQNTFSFEKSNIPQKITPSSNMITPDSFRMPYSLNERIGEYGENVVVLKTGGKVSINGKMYSLPPSAIELNKKGNGIGILKTINVWFTHPEAIANSIIGGVKQKRNTTVSAQSTNKTVFDPSDKVERFVAGAIKSSTVAIAIKGDVAPYGRYTISAYINSADLKKMLDGKLNPLEVIQKGGFSLTFNRTRLNANKGITPIESADSNSVNFSPMGGISKAFGKKETVKTGNVSLELSSGFKFNPFNSQVGAITGPKLSFKIPGSEKIVDAFLNTLKKWTERSIAASTFTTPELIPVELGLIGLISAIQSTKPAIAVELGMPLSANLNYKTGNISLSTQGGDQISGNLPQLANSFIDTIGLNKYVRFPGGKAH